MKLNGVNDLICLAFDEPQQRKYFPAGTMSVVFIFLNL
jgi:hypothetical protein